MSDCEEEENSLRLCIKRSTFMGIDGYICDLPLPFVKGLPADYHRMTPDELRKFIQFAYSSVFKKQLPQSSKTTQKIPSWWPTFVTFDKNLKVVVVAELDRENPMTQCKELAGLLDRFYGGFGMKVLLEMAKLLSDPDKDDMYFIEGTVKEPCKITTHDGKTIMYIDQLTRSYDLPGKLRGKATKVGDFLPLIGVETLNRIHKAVDKKNAASKRRLFDDFGEEIPKAFPCQFCKREYILLEFRDDHEAECMKGPRGNRSQDSFMAALGLQNASMTESQPKPSSSRSTAGDDVPNQTQPTIKRALRKLPKRNLLLSLVKNNPLPLTSQRGQRRIKEIGENVEHTFPPTYEKYCQSRTSYRGRETKYQNVAKKAIEKDGEHPHIYSYGRRQRIHRNSELIIGLKSSCWKLLNKCKDAKVVVKKIKPVMTTVKVDLKKIKRSYIEDRFKGALILPRVKLVDLMTHPTPEVTKYMKPKRKISSEIELTRVTIDLKDIVKYPTAEALKFLNKTKQ